MIASPKLEQQGYRMIETITIKNFRSFDDVEINDIKTVNVVVGRNASGKTALLEALYFTLGSPSLSFKLRNWRGLGVEVRYDDTNESKSSIWRDLFYDFDQSNAVSIAFKGTENVNRRVRITCSERESQAFKSKLGGTVIRQVPPIKFEYFKSNKPLGSVIPTFTEEGIKLGDSLEPMSGAFFPSNVPIDQEEIAIFFSKLGRTHAQQPTIAAMNELFDFIEDLSIELIGKTPKVFVSIKNREEKIPIGLVSTGVTKIFAYLVAIASQKGGIVIIDEIENGFYYDTLPQIWKSLYKFAKRYEVQLFVSTHSEECLSALESIVSEHPEDFTLLRAEKESGKPSIIKHFDGKGLLNALELDIDPR
jgi:AAA15 family ATPase/GTPase